MQVFDDAGRLRTEARVARASVTDVDYASGGQTIAVSDLTGKVALLNASTMSAAGKPVQLDAFEGLVKSINEFWLTKVRLPQPHRPSA